MRSSNPVLTRLTPETTPAGPQAGYGSPYGTAPAPPTAVAAADRMTIDDVVVKTVSLLGLLGISAVATALVVKTPGQMMTAWIGGALIGLVLGLIISFKRIVNPPLIMTYAVVEGVFVGAISKAYSETFEGIVVQAALATFGIFFVMAALYKARVIRSSPKFARGVIGAMFGVLAIILGNFLLSAVFHVDLGLRNGSPLAIIFSLVIIVIGALSFILDFDLVEQSIAQGAEKKTAWLAAFGILVGLIWVYLEVLRLLSYLRGRD